MSEEQNQDENMPKPGEKYEIPVEGSLGLLALGHHGLIAWRQKKREAGPEAPELSEKESDKSEE